MINEMQHVGYHIHMDLEKISPDFTAFLKKRGFYHDPFDKQPGDSNSTPEHHFTIKLGTDDAKKFRRLKDEISNRAVTDVDVKGYLEAEVVYMCKIPDSPYTGNAHPPFFLVTRSLTESEEFRQSEFHARMHADQSHPDLVQSLFEANTGMYTVHRRKNDGIHVLFTAQGYTKTVDHVVMLLIDYLDSTGGTYSGRIVRELIAGYQFFGDFGLKDLPKIIDRVEHRA